MSGHSKRFAEPIGLKVTKEQFGCLKRIAEQDAKPLAEWCRDKVLEAIQARGTNPGEYAIMAELSVPIGDG